MVKANAAAKWVCLGVLGAGVMAFADEPDPIIEGRAPDAETTVTGKSEQEDLPGKPLISLFANLGIAEPLQDAGIDVGGLVEGSYTYSLSNPPGDLIVGRAFDLEHEDPTLNQVMLYIGRVTDFQTPWDLGFRVEMLYGADARFISANGLFDHDGFEDGPENQFDLTQAYGEIVIPIGNGLKTKIGKFITPLGYELINPSGNILFSHSYLFGIVPFTHTGVLATYPVSDELEVSLGFSRGWDQAMEDNNDAINMLGSIGYTVSDQTSVYFNFSTGPEQDDNEGRYRTALDLYATHEVNERLSLAVNTTYVFDARAGDNQNDVHAYGVAGYARYLVNNQLTMNGRLEWFNDHSAFLGLDTVVYEATLGVTLTPFADNNIASNLKIRPEIRVDWADDAVFDAGTDHHQVTLGVDAYFTF